MQKTKGILIIILASAAKRGYIVAVGGFPGKGSPPPFPPADIFIAPF